MPIYEYVCHGCRRRVSIFWWTVAQAESGTARCPRCGSDRLKRIVSRVAFLRSEEDHIESMLDPATLGDLDENDPRSVRRFMEKMKPMLGDEIGEDEWDEMMEEMESEMTKEEGAEEGEEEE